MNVAELKKLLDSVPDDHIVVLSKDGEGNGYDSAYDSAIVDYDESDKEIYGEEYYKDEGYTDEEIQEILKHCVKAFVLWP